MYNNDKKYSKNFPDPLASREMKMSEEYGMKYAKAIENQWGKMSDRSSLYSKRSKVFEKNRDYANGVQDTTIYRSYREIPTLTWRPSTQSLLLQRTKRSSVS